MQPCTGLRGVGDATLHGSEGGGAESEGCHGRLNPLPSLLHPNTPPAHKPGGWIYLSANGLPQCQILVKYLLSLLAAAVCSNQLL